MKTKNNKTGLARTARIAVMLLLTLITSASAWGNDQLSQAPMGNIEGCTGGRLAIHVWGWTCDPYYEVWDKNVLYLNNTHWDGIDRIVSPNDWIWTRTKLALSAFATQWYLANHNKAKIQLWKDGVKVKEVEVNPNVRRDDVVNYYKF